MSRDEETRPGVASGAGPQQVGETNAHGTSGLPAVNDPGLAERSRLFDEIAQFRASSIRCAMNALALTRTYVSTNGGSVDDQVSAVQALRGFLVLGVDLAASVELARADGSAE
jgi:hypothetical protein